MADVTEERWKRCSTKLVVSPLGERQVVVMLSPAVNVRAPVLTSRPFGAGGLMRYGAAGSIVVERDARGLRTIRVTRADPGLTWRHPELQRRCVIELAGPERSITQAVYASAGDEVCARAEALLASQLRTSSTRHG